MFFYELFNILYVSVVLTILPFIGLFYTWMV